MKTIWKYELSPDMGNLMLPEGARILSVHTQFEKAQLWALVDPSKQLVPYKILVLGTGHETAEPMDEFTFIGTFQLDGGRFVFHAFYR